MTASASRWDGIALRLTGTSAYRPTWALQREIWARRRDLRVPDTLLLVEHDPVVTIGKHGDERFLAAHDRSADVVRIDRGGEVTYHGPGQLTAYLIADLRAHDLSVRGFVHALEEAVLRTLASYGIRAVRRDGLVGVWVRRGEGFGKAAAAGVRIARGVSMHGIALNVADCLGGFDGMVPCGLRDARVTTMAELLEHPPALPDVAERLTRAMSDVFGVELRALTAPGPQRAEDVAALVTGLERQAARGARRPPWLRISLPKGNRFAGVRRILSEGSLCTVCEEARCPNRQECWDAGTATFMILGNVCTRRCRFCAVAKGTASPVDPQEPERVAQAAARMGLEHVVVTSVTRDDLPDSGAQQFAQTIAAVRDALPAATVEVLISDLGGSPDALARVLAQRPDVLNHNIETVPRLYPIARPGADYQRSLAVLRRAHAAGLCAKSGFMIGLGESPREIVALLRDLRAAGCTRVTIGQYLQARRECLTVKRYYTPEEFAVWDARARELGFDHVESAPLVRSSYHAGEALRSS